MNSSSDIAYNHACRKCDLHKSSKNVCVEGDGPRDAKIVVIGEAPGEAEARTGKPFCGKSGQLLRAELARVGLLDKVFITNTAKCRPPDNRAPTNEEIKACREYLDAELEAIKPEYVITLGAVASKAVLKKSKITQDHGDFIRSDKVDYIGYPTFHPAYALRDPSKLPALRQDLERLAREMRGENVKKEMVWEAVNYGNIDQFIEEFKAAEKFSYDTETSGLFMHAPDFRIRCLGIGLRDKVWVIPLKMPRSPFPLHSTQYKLLHLITNLATGKRAVAANGKFDNQCLVAAYGCYFHLNFDVGLAKHLIEENTPNSLKSMATNYLDADYYDMPLKDKLSDADPPKIWKYCAYDCRYTYDLEPIFDRVFKKEPPLRRLFYKLVMPAARVMMHAELNGFTIDMPKFKATEDELRKRIAKLEGQLQKAAEINWNSPQQVGEFLYGKLGITPSVFTDTGAASTGEEALYAIKDEHPIAKTLVDYREATKFLSTYIEGWKEFMVGDKLYLSTKLHGTVTGRWSSRLHQVPRDGTIRNLVISPGEWTFVQADLSQAELRIVAELSQDPEMIECFRKGIDIHWRTLLFVLEAGAAGEYYEQSLDTAKRISRTNVKGIEQAVRILTEAGHEKAIELWKGWKEARKKAKGINFGYVYGMGAPKFVEYAKLKYGFEPTLEESVAIRDAYFHLYHNLPAWHTRQRKLVRLDAQVRNLAGRVRRLPGATSTDRSLVSEAERQAINSPVQGVIGDIKAMALVEIDQSFTQWELKILGEVHDSILLQVRTSELARVLPLVRKIMRAPKLLKEFNINLSVPLEADLEVGPWGAGVTFRD